MKQYLLKIGGREMWDGYHPSEQDMDAGQII